MAENEIVAPGNRSLQVDETSKSMMEIIANAAKDPAVNVDKMGALLDLQERLMSKQAEAEFNAAFSRVLAKLPRIKKNGEVSYPVNKNQPDGPKKKAFDFGRYEDIDEIIRPLELEEGFSRSFTTAPRTGDGGGLIITCRLLHIRGHHIEASMPLPLDTSGGKNNLQGGGSTFSYGKRYTTTGIWNLIFEGQDDDGKLGGTEWIDEESALYIEQLIAETNTDLWRFLQNFEVKEVRNLPKDNKTPAINMLLAKKKQLNAGAPKA